MINLSKPLIKDEEKKAVLEVLSSGHLSQGQKVFELEKQFAKLCQTKYAVAVSSGTSAIYTALYASGIGKGDEVITSPFTFIATANAILMAGAIPVFADIDSRTFNIDISEIEKAVTPKTKAILTVNLYGQPADYEGIKKIARKFNLLVIEDAAQSVGASYQKKKSGNLGDIGCFSLYATKNIMSGEGGMLTTSNKDYYHRAKRFRNHGQMEGRKYVYHDLGYNFRMTDIQAAIALVQLQRLNEVTKKRQETAGKYDKAFQNIKGLTTPYTARGRTHVYHQYTLKITDKFPLGRDKFKTYLEEKGIQTQVYYPAPVYYAAHLQKFIGKKIKSESEKAAKEVLSIPVHPQLSSSDINYIIDTICNI